MNFSHAPRLVYWTSVLLVHTAFVSGFAFVLWREGRPPDISLRHLAEITALLQRENYPAAIPRLRAATGIAPEDDQAQYLLGIALSRAGDPGGAKAAYQRVLYSKPWHSEAHFRLGLIHLEQKNLDAAIWHNRIVIKLQPANAEALTNLGVALMRQGKHAEAVEQLRTALRVKPGFVPAQKNLDLMSALNLLPPP